MYSLKHSGSNQYVTRRHVMEDSPSLTWSHLNQSYSASLSHNIENTPPHSWMQHPFVGFDLETTGVDPFSDVPISFAFIDTNTSTPSILINPHRPIPPSATAIHHITDQQAKKGIPLKDATDYIGKRLLELSNNRVPLVGMNIAFDLTMIDTQWRSIYGHGLQDEGWDGPVIDLLVLDRHMDSRRPGRRNLTILSEHYGIPFPNQHDASADAWVSVQCVRALGMMHPTLAQRTLSELEWDQSVWHDKWFTQYNQYRIQHNLEPMDPRQKQWPIHAASSSDMMTT